ncbi:MAG: catalase family protein [Beijerinckiaceae bacterium]|nr:catalase family protein [Beijerinckiaceae bacterium]MCI0736236.1 catalase family protein [Beijerinckiaceae bacterium]
MLRNGYVLYDESVETIQPDEEVIGDRILASGRRASEKVFEKRGVAVRAAHAKGHGILKGELIVDADLPEHLRQGVFAAPGMRYPIIVRFSTGLNDIRSDNVKAALGMAIKVLGVSGEKELPDDSSANQDFLLVNHPVYFANVAAYEEITKRLEHLPDLPDILLMGAEAAASTFESILTKFGLRAPVSISAVADPGNNILGETFWSMAALRFGDYIAKLSAAPLSESVRRLRNESAGSGDNILQAIVSDFFKDNSAEYELRAQLCTDLEKMPVEDASVEWPAAETDKEPRFWRLGRIVLPAHQQPNSPERRRYGEDILSFTPWRCLAAHRPLGSIMRLRKKVYDISSADRHLKTKQPRTEPRAINELPD